MANEAFAAALGTQRQTDRQYTSTPFMAAYWTSFIGERSAMNRQRMTEQLSRFDPETLGKMLRDSQANIARLEESRADITARWQQGELARQRSETSGKWAVAAQQVAASGQSDAARIAVSGRIAERGMDLAFQAQARQDLSAGGRASVSHFMGVADSARVAAAKGEAQPVGSVDATIAGLDAATAAEQGDPYKRHTAAQALYDYSVSQNDQRAAIAVALVFNGVDPQEAKRIAMDDAAISKVAPEFLSVPPPATYEAPVDEALSKIWGGGGAPPAPGLSMSGSTNTSMSQGGPTPAGGAQGAAAGVPGSTYTPGVGGPATGHLDEAIRLERERARALQDQWSAALSGASASDRFAGYRHNYLLENQFRTRSSRQDMIDRITEMAQRDPRRLEEVVTLYKTQGRDAALAMLRDPAQQYETLGAQAGPMLDLYGAVTSAQRADTDGKLYWYRVMLDSVDAMDPTTRIPHERAAQTLRDALESYRTTGDPVELDIGLEAAIPYTDWQGRVDPNPTSTKAERDVWAERMGRGAQEREAGLLDALARSREQETEYVKEMGRLSTSPDPFAMEMAGDLGRRAAEERALQEHLATSLQRARGLDSDATQEKAAAAEAQRKAAMLADAVRRTEGPGRSALLAQQQALLDEAAGHARRAAWYEDDGALNYTVPPPTE